MHIIAAIAGHFVPHLWHSLCSGERSDLRLEPETLITTMTRRGRWYSGRLARGLRAVRCNVALQHLQFKAGRQQIAPAKDSDCECDTSSEFAE